MTPPPYRADDEAIELAEARAAILRAAQRRYAPLIRFLGPWRWLMLLESFCDGIRLSHDVAGGFLFWADLTAALTWGIGFAFYSLNIRRFKKDLSP